MPKFLIAGTFDGNKKYWNGCGWTDDRSTAERCSEQEARGKLDRMQKEGMVSVRIERLEKKC